MKNLLIPILALAAVTSAFSQGIDNSEKISQLQTIVREGTQNPYSDSSPGRLSTLSNSLVDRNGNITVSSWDLAGTSTSNTTLRIYNRNQTSPYTSGFHTDVVFPKPAANSVITMPSTTGSVPTVSASVLTPSSTIAWTPGAANMWTDIPAGDQTINLTTTGMVVGQIYTLVFSPSTTATITLGTNIKKTGTVVTGGTGKVATWSGIWDGTNLNEIGRAVNM